MKEKQKVPKDIKALHEHCMKIREILHSTKSQRTLFFIWDFGMELKYGADSRIKIKKVLE